MQRSTIPPTDEDQKVALLHASFRGTTLFGGELAKMQKANTERASALTVFTVPKGSPSNYVLRPYTGRCKSFRDVTQDTSAPFTTITKPPQTSADQTTMTVTVPQDSYKRKGQSHDEAPQVKKPVEEEAEEIENSQNEGVLPTTSASRRATKPVCGGVEAYNERSLRVKYRNQGVQTSFYESTPSAQDLMGNRSPQEPQKVQ